VVALATEVKRSAASHEVEKARGIAACAPSFISVNKDHTRSPPDHRGSYQSLVCFVPVLADADIDF